jgi:hypothetical protein
MGEEICQQGFRISFDVKRNVSVKENPIYPATPYPQPTQVMYEQHTVITVTLTGKVANELFRDLASCNLCFSTMDSNGNAGEKTVILPNLGPHENQEFTVPLGQKTDVPEYDVKVKLLRFEYVYKDGKKEVIQF